MSTTINYYRHRDLSENAFQLFLLRLDLTQLYSSAMRSPQLYDPPSLFFKRRVVTTFTLYLANMYLL